MTLPSTIGTSTAPATLEMPADGVHECVDAFGNTGFEVRSCTSQTLRIFTGQLSDDGDRPLAHQLGSIVRSIDGIKRKLFVVIDMGLPISSRTELDHILRQFLVGGTIEAYEIADLVLVDAAKTLSTVASLIEQAKSFGMRRRDIFVAAGPSMLLDLVGFAAATYRRSTPFIAIPTTIEATLLSHDIRNKVILHYAEDGHIIRRDVLALHHVPLASLASPQLILLENHAERIAAFLTLLRIALTGHAELFFYLQQHADYIVDDRVGKEILLNATSLYFRVLSDASPEDNPENRLIPDLSQVISRFLSVPMEAQDMCNQREALGLAFMAALPHDGSLTDRQLDIVLKVLRQAGMIGIDNLRSGEDSLSRYDHAQPFGCTESTVVIPRGIGKARTLHISTISQAAIKKTFDRIRNVQCKEMAVSPPAIYSHSLIQMEPTNLMSTVDQQISYRVVTVPNIFAPSNPTLADLAYGKFPEQKKHRILVVVDDYTCNSAPALEHYFGKHKRPKSIIHFLLLKVTSHDKDITSVLKIVKAALDLGMCNDDLFIVVGGGTIMDVVGFAAAIYLGGTPYIRVPTTLLGMIDAGVGVKVGVNLESHKSSIGRYYAPVACLNDRETFLKTLPKREIACGFAEAIKMAIVKSESLFRLIESNQMDLEDAKYVETMMTMSVHEMLLELQPNLLETDLRRIADFGHEFGHIVESISDHSIPHGECVAIGIAIASMIANLQDLLSTADLQKILDLLLAIGLPIYTTVPGCCCPDVLWAKISTSGVEHKDGKLLLTIPTSIGSATFINDLSDISKEVVTEAVLLLKQLSQRPKLTIPSRLQSPSPPNSASPDNKDISLPRLPSAQSISIIGASGDLGSVLAQHIIDKRQEGVICLARSSSLHKLHSRLGCSGARTRILLGDILHPVHLRTIIRDTNTLINMAGIVTLSSPKNEHASVLAVNGFAQGVICHLIFESGSEKRIKFIYPSTQRTYLIISDARALQWIEKAIDAFSSSKSAITKRRDITRALHTFAADFVSSHPIPANVNVYELSKLLGERMVSTLPYHAVLRISGVYGPGFTRGFIQRAINPKSTENFEAAEIRDFIYVDDVVQVILSAATSRDASTFDVASGESWEINKVWKLIRNLLKDDAKLRVTGDPNATKIKLRPDTARRLLGRDFVGLSDGLRAVLKLRNVMVRNQGRVDEIVKPNECLSTPSLTCIRLPSGSPIIMIDVGATYLRAGIIDGNGTLLPTVKRYVMPSRHLFPSARLEDLQERCVEEVVAQVKQLVDNYKPLLVKDVGVAFGAVIKDDGIVMDSSIIWGSTQTPPFDLKLALSNRMPHMNWVLINDVSAAAWRYMDEGRFCLITVSSGLSNKIFDSNAAFGQSLNLDSEGLGGEMGHVVIEPKAVENLVKHAKQEACAYPEIFKMSALCDLTIGDPDQITARLIGRAVVSQDQFALKLVDSSNLPWCPCGTIADLCSYSSGRAALLSARKIAGSGLHAVDNKDIDDLWLASAIANRDPLAMRVLSETTYPLAVRIIQLAADVGLHKFILVGGFATKTGKTAYLETLQNHLVDLCSPSGFFKDWSDKKIRSLVRLGASDDLDGLIGVANYVRNQKEHYSAVRKKIGSVEQSIVSRPIPICGARQILTKVVFAGICTTDLQILCGDRGLEPEIMGHEGVCRVTHIGHNVQGVQPGDFVVLNPNNPIDDLEKLGHNSEGLFQQYFKFGQELIDRRQVLHLPHKFPRIVDTLIEPLSCVTTAQERVKPYVTGKRVLVIGAGLMGLLFVMTSRKAGASKVILANRSTGRLRFAITSRIIEEQDTMTIDALHDEASQNHQFDMVFVCVSLGQGASVTQQATTVLKPGGCIYLYAGFKSGDTLTTDSCPAFDITPIRVHWMTETITINQKSVVVSGHRGTRHEDLLYAARQISEDPIEFSKVLSHVISLDSVPRIMEVLRQGGLINEVSPQRIVVDVGARNSFVDSIAEIALRHLLEAAKKPFELIPDGNMFRHIGFDGDRSMIGWALPPHWQDVITSLAQVLQGRALNLKRHFVFVATGNWGFAVHTIRDLVQSRGYNQLHVLQSLDPRSLRSLLFEIGNLAAAVFIGVSQSGMTMETIALMRAIGEVYSQNDLDFNNHSIWLTDLSPSTHGGQFGETVLRNQVDGVWATTEMYPLTVQNERDINALFCTPHSFVIFLALAIQLDGNLELMYSIWTTYLSHRVYTSRQLLPMARSFALENTDQFQIKLKATISVQSVKHSLRQNLEQSLGSKRKHFKPHVSFIDPGDPDKPEHLSIETTKPVPEIVMALLYLNAFSIFTAAVAYHMEIVFVTHPDVGLYKRKMSEIVTTNKVVPDIPDLASIKDIITRALGQMHPPRMICLLHYGFLEPGLVFDLRTWLLSLESVKGSAAIIEVEDGETWNHSCFQAAISAHDSLYLCMNRTNYECGSTPYGAIFNENATSLRVMAQATAEVLAPFGIFLPFGRNI